MSSVEIPSSRTSARITKAEEYDLVMLGSGFGSKFLAWTFAEQGQRVATIERKYLGGSCPNIACLPSKNIIHSAKVASYFRRSQESGIAHDGFTIDLNETHLCRLLRDYLTYYHGCRTHLSLEKDAPEPRPVEGLDQGGIVETPRVRGLHHRDTLQAA